MEEIIRLTKPVMNKREAIWSLLKSIAFYSTIAAVTAGIIYTSRGAHRLIARGRVAALTYLMEWDFKEKEITLDRKGKVAKGGDLTEQQTLEALYLCTSQNEQYAIQFDTIKSFMEQ